MRISDWSSDVCSSDLYTSLPQPRFSTVSVNDLIHAVIQLMDPDLKQQGILLTSGVRPADLAIAADAEQLQMVLINLVKNARDALEGTSDGSISLKASRNQQQQVGLQVTDNGQLGGPPCRDRGWQSG